MGEINDSLEGEADNQKLHTFKDMSYLLKTIVKEKGISIEKWRDEIGVTDSTARWHLKAKPPRIPSPNYWRLIANLLDMHFKEVEQMFREELDAQGRIRSCLVCKKEVLQLTSRKYLCGAVSCTREYDRKRKASQRQKTHQWKRLNDSEFNQRISRTGKKFSISREEVDRKVEEFLKGGGEVEQLPPAIADGITGEPCGEKYTARPLPRLRVDPEPEHDILIDCEHG